MMKKIVFCIFVLCCINKVFAGEMDGVRFILFDGTFELDEVVAIGRSPNGNTEEIQKESLPTLSYIQIEDLFNSGDSPCYENAKKDGLTDIASKILSLCREQLGAINEEVKKYQQKLKGDVHDKKDTYDKFEKFSYKIEGELSSLNVRRQLSRVFDLDLEKVCLVSLESLKKEFSNLAAEAGEEELEKRYLASGGSLDSCIANLNIMSFDAINRINYYDKAYLDNPDVCPIRVTVTQEDIDGLWGLDEKFLGKDYSFNLSYFSRLTSESKDRFEYAAKQDSAVAQTMWRDYAYEKAVERYTHVGWKNAIIFNGKVLIVCVEGMPTMVMKPSFSGYVGCQEAKYQNHAGVGGIPNGVYIIDHDSVESMTGNAKNSWGEFRIPLVPAKETDTFGRTNMYLHGTTNPDKKRSGGCISLGLSIDEFVKSEYFKKYSESLVFVVTE